MTGFEPSTNPQVSALGRVSRTLFTTKRTNTAAYPWCADIWSFLFHSEDAPTPEFHNRMPETLPPVPTGRLWIGRSHTGNRPMTHLLSVGRFEPSAANAQLFHQGEESREARTSGRILPQVGQIALRISPGFTPSSAGPHKPHKTK